MKKILISSLFSICIALFMMVNVSSPLVAEEDEIIIFLGTQTFLPGEPDPFEWECHGDFTDCTEVYIIHRSKN